MKKMNNKGLSIIEIVITFSMIMFFCIGLLVIVANYRNKVTVSLKKLDLDTFKNNITQDINNDLLRPNYVLNEINTAGDCPTLTADGATDRLSKCINFEYKDLSFPNDPTKNVNRAFGIGAIDVNSKSSVENKFLYYDGIKYPIKDKLPKELPVDDNGNPVRSWADFQEITIYSEGMLDSSIVVLEDGTKVTIYRIDVNVNHIDYEDDFGVHIVATTDSVPVMEAPSGN